MGGKIIMLEQAMKIIKEYIKDAMYGIFDTRNIADDNMSTLYDDGELKIDICYGYGYFEVFGLNDEDFFKLAEYYEQLKEKMNNRIDEHDRQLRVDAIEEFVEKCKVKFQEQNIEMEYECPFLDIIDIQKIAGELKEQNK